MNRHNHGIDFCAQLPDHAINPRAKLGNACSIASRNTKLSLATGDDPNINPSVTNNYRLPCLTDVFTGTA